MLNQAVTDAGAHWGSPFGNAPPQSDEERPPVGCDRDAYKLFLSTVPKSWDVPDLKRVLEEFGTVRSPSPLLSPLSNYSTHYVHTSQNYEHPHLPEDWLIEGIDFALHLLVNLKNGWGDSAFSCQSCL